MEPIIQFSDVTYYHPGSDKNSQPALNNISINIEAGEWVAILGANGSGKTTFARHCNALLVPSSGKVFVKSKDTQQPANLITIRSQVGMVFQNPEDQIVATIIEEDTAFGPENLGVPSHTIQERVAASLESVKMTKHKNRPPHLLSAGQMQRVALAGVLAMQPECIIFDESTAMLDPRGRQDVMEEMRRLHERGITVLFITHFMEEAARADRVIVLNQGALAFDGNQADLFADTSLLKQCGLEQPLTLQLMDEVRAVSSLFSNLPMNFEQALKAIPEYLGKSVLRAGSSTTNGLPPIVKIENLKHTYMPGTPLAHPALVDVSMEVTSGKAHGLAGGTGSGKSTLLQHLNGLYRPQSGSIRVGNFSFDDVNLDIKALRRFAGLVFQNPEIYFFEQFVGDEIAYGPKMLFGKEGLRERVQNAMSLVGLDFEKFKDRITYTLSGGEKRKVALAATLAVQPKLLILDEPTAGLDPASRRNLHTTLKGFQQNGIDMILSSHSMGDITELTQNMTIMAEGRAMRTGNTAELFNDSQLIADASLGQPSVVRLAGAFRSKGWPIPANTVTTQQLIASLQEITRGGQR